MKNLLSCGVLVAGMVFCLGCADGPPPSTDAETEQLYESPEYEKEMMGEMSGGGEDATP